MSWINQNQVHKPVSLGGIFDPFRASLHRDASEKHTILPPHIMRRQGKKPSLLLYDEVPVSNSSRSTKISWRLPMWHVFCSRLHNTKWRIKISNVGSVKQQFRTDFLQLGQTVISVSFMDDTFAMTACLWLGCLFLGRLWTLLTCDTTRFQN